MPGPPGSRAQTAQGTSAPELPAVAPRSSAGLRTLPGSIPMRESAADTAARRRQALQAVLPAGIVAVTALAAMVYLIRAQDDGTAGGPAGGVDGATAGGVLAGFLLISCAVLVGAVLFAGSEARATLARYAQLRRGAERSRTEVSSQLAQLEQGELPAAPVAVPVPEPSGGALDLLAHQLALAQRTAEAAVGQAATLLRVPSGGGSDDKVVVFVNLARRLQSLVHREIRLLDELENQVEDPDLLRRVFQIDHLATRIRRYSENLAVLGGAVPRRQWTSPVAVTEVLRSSIAEVEHYQRVKLVPPVEGTLRGHAVADVIHLLSELVENATAFSAPQTQVLLRAQHVAAGLALEVEDRGLGMTEAEQQRMNGLLQDPDQVDVGALLADGRIGLYVVSSLARRHGIAVRLQNNIYGGIQAVLVLPRSMLGGPEQQPGSVTRDVADTAADHTPDDTAAPLPAQRGAPDRQRPPSPAAAAGPPPEAPSPARPSLPKRRSQENLAPQLREPPRAPAHRDEPEAGHDPGLMAAFQRGIQLAGEAEESTGTDPTTAPSGDDTP